MFTNTTWAEGFLSRHIIFTLKEGNVTLIATSQILTTRQYRLIQNIIVKFSIQKPITSEIQKYWYSKARGPWWDTMNNRMLFDMSAFQVGEIWTFIMSKSSGDTEYIHHTHNYVPSHYNVRIWSRIMHLYKLKKCFRSLNDCLHLVWLSVALFCPS